MSERKKCPRLPTTKSRPASTAAMFARSLVAQVAELCLANLADETLLETTLVGGELLLVPGR